MKSFIKIREIIDKYPSINVTKMKNEIDKYKYISFDIFDTLIKRDVYQEKGIYT